jgi:hypothetical protein
MLGLCEVYFNEGGELTGWSDPVQPKGDNAADLRLDLKNMLMDAWRWKPVRWNELKPGFRFERIVSQDEEKQLTAVLEARGVIASD